MENIREALEYAVELALRGQEVVTSDDGTEYYDATKARMVRLETKHYPQTLHLSTLDSLIDYLKSDLNNVNSQKLMVVVESPVEVSVITEDDEDEVRSTLVNVRSLNPTFKFGRYEAAAEFNVSLQSNFINSDDREVVLNFSSALKVENGSEIVDNGISQTTTIKNGVVSLAKATAPNPVVLRPYRTFLEVEQPSSQFVFRINKCGEMAIFEADGGKWRLEAINNVANYLKEKLADQNNLTILA